MAKEQFFHPESAELLKTLDEAARRSGVSRGQAFEDFLHMALCSLSGGRMEDQYLAVVKKHSEGKLGKRGCDSIAELFGKAVAAMEETRGETKDILGDLYQGAITYGEAGQYFSPEPIARMMAAMTVGDVPEEAKHERKSVCDPACGSGRMLLAVAETQPHWLFVGQDVDLRCVRMCAINFALRNLYGYVIHGNTLADERRLIYRTGFDLVGVVSEVPLDNCPEPVRKIVTEPTSLAEPATTLTSTDEPREPRDDADPEPTRRTNQLRLF
ncbi:MAG: SAM-dependent DNA methyltransferase [Planctomycetes bacterium]|nr:SAM-dependent DNA methyltransferase [Planctomycetota bacterium]